MYDIDVCILDRVPTAKLLESKTHSLETGAEAEISYDRKSIRINLTGVWDLAFREYDTFLDELIGSMIHEYLHYFFHINGIPQNEKMVHRLANYLLVLSLERLIGATSGKAEDIKQYEEYVLRHFKS
jgi:hypothetical protein